MNAQRSAVEQHAKSVGGEVVAEFRDVESGRKADRSGLAAVAEHEREMISQRTKAALAVAKVRGTRLGNPCLPPPGMARVEAANARAVAAYRGVLEAARMVGARSLGDYTQALQAARAPAPRGGKRWSWPSVVRVLRYCTRTID